jgi:hypothetical protein
MDACRRRFTLALLAAIAMPALAATPKTSLAEIERLIARVQAARGVIFIRNGREYTASEAAAHLRRKWKAADGRIQTAEQFIDLLGSRSSMSGRVYRVRFSDGRELDSAVWLRGLLRELRRKP